MPNVLPLRSDDPRRIGRYRISGRIENFLDIDDIPVVFLARAPDGAGVALTVLPRDRVADAAARDRFTAEARAARRVAPFCTARVLDAGIEGQLPYVVSEYVTGATLGEVAETEGRQSGAVLTAVAIGAATGLAAIHQAGLVHGAFSPDHVVLGREGPRVVHFSITPPYGAATPAADMLAWAQTVLFAALGRPAIGPQDLAALPRVLRGSAAACVAPDPAARPDARAVLSELLGRDDPTQGLLAEGSRRARMAGRAEAPAHAAEVKEETRRTSRVVMWAAACAVCVLAIAGAAWFVTGGHVGSRGARLTASAKPVPPSPRPTVTASIPSALAGTWSGQVHQTSPELTVPVRIVLTAGATSGQVTYPTLGCSGRLQVMSPAASGVTMSQTIETGRQNCDDGVVTLTMRPDGDHVAFSFRRPGGPSPAGMLTRQ
jgi:serine/threonine protein kinase